MGSFRTFVIAMMIMYYKQYWVIAKRLAELENESDKTRKFPKVCNSDESCGKWRDESIWRLNGFLLLFNFCLFNCDVQIVLVDWM